MKWFVFIGALLAVIPAGQLLRSAPRLQPWLWTLVGLMPFLLVGALDINVVSYEAYRGDSRGIEITVLDLLLASLWIARTPRANGPWLFRGAYAAYLTAALLSVQQAADPVFSWFSIWKLVRMYVVLHVVTAAARDRRTFYAILRGMAIGVLGQLAIALLQRYALGFHQTPGLFAHQNSLGTAVCMVAPAFLAMALAQPRSWLHWSAVAAGALVLVLGLSRGALGLFVLAMGLTFLASLLRSFASYKVAALGLSVVFAGAVLVKAMDSIVDRFVSAPEESAEARVEFENVAARMLKDHPFGIGINQYSLAIVQQGYADEDGSKKLTSDGDAPAYGGIAHNIYWLTAAELGYPGILAFAWLVLAPTYKGFALGWRLRGARGDVLIGLGIGLLALWLHGMLEWTFRQTSISYLFWILLGLVASAKVHGSTGLSAGPPASEPPITGSTPADRGGSAGRLTRHRRENRATQRSRRSSPRR